MKYEAFSETEKERMNLLRVTSVRFWRLDRSSKFRVEVEIDGQRKVGSAEESGFLQGTRLLGRGQGSEILPTATEPTGFTSVVVPIFEVRDKEI